MKKVVLWTAIVAFVGMFIPIQAFSSGSGIPEGVPEKGDYESSLVHEMFMIEVMEGKVVFQVPIIKWQLEKEGSNISNPHWQLYASVFWTDGKKWFSLPREDYSIPTSMEGGRLKGICSLSEKGNGWHWVRVWGRDKISGNWLWIDQKSPYCRYDLDNKPGYEVLVNEKKEKIIKVPRDYSTRP